MRHTIQVLVENKFGVLARIASLFSARGYNIDSLAVSETQDPTISCITLVVNAEDERILEQIKKQLHKLIDTITVVDLTRKGYIDRELYLVKIPKNAQNGVVLQALGQQFPVKIIGESDEFYILEVCAQQHEVELILRELKKCGIRELVGTGKIAITK